MQREDLSGSCHDLSCLTIALKCLPLPEAEGVVLRRPHYPRTFNLIAYSSLFYSGEACHDDPVGVARDRARHPVERSVFVQHPSAGGDLASAPSLLRPAKSPILRAASCERLACWSGDAGLQGPVLRSSFIPPCNPTLRDRLPKGEGWLFLPRRWCSQSNSSGTRHVFAIVGLPK